ncbi:MAG: hypothetical protein WC779_05625 [Candidatus Omnitrophota bacterium]|jgi:hypothetical protein
MNKRIFGLIAVILALSFIIASSSVAVEKETTGTKVKSFWQKLFSYPAKATDQSVAVVAETAKSTTTIVTKEVTTVGQVTSGDVDKAKALVTEPVNGVGETTYNAVKDTANIPVEAAKDEPAMPAEVK